MRPTRLSMLQRLRFDRCKSFLNPVGNAPQGRFSTIFYNEKRHAIKATL
jgi:hypothetical protein